MPFQASSGWFQRFLKRKGLKNVHLTSERASADIHAAAAFPSILQDEVNEEGYTDLTIFNMDETGMLWKRLPSTTYILKQQRQARGRKADKSRYTVILCTNAAGNFKMKPFVIHKAKRPRAFRNLRDMSESGVYWSQQAKAWATSSLVVEWFDLFVKDAKQHCKKHGVPFKVLLLMDNAPCHPQYLASRHPQVNVIFFPPNTTSLLQPLDQEIIANTKLMYSQFMYRKFLAAVTSDALEVQVLQKIRESEPTSGRGGETDSDEASSDDESDTSQPEPTTPKDVQTVAEFWCCYNIKDSIDGLLRAWGKISQATIIHAWRLILPHLRSTTPVAPAEPQEVQQQLAEVVNVARQVPGCAEVTEEDVMDMVNCSTDTFSAVLDEVVEGDALEHSERDRQADSVCAEARWEMTMKNLSDVLVTVDLLKEQAQEWDENLERCSKFVSDIEKASAPYKDLHNRKFNERRQQLITRYLSARAVQPPPSPKPEPQPGPSHADSDENLLEISEADFEGFLQEAGMEDSSQ